MSNNNEIESTFFLSFCGQKIIMTTTLTHNITNEHQIESVPLSFEGILLDYDEDYYFLSKNGQEVTQAVRKNSVVHIMTIEDKNLFDQILDQMPDPRDGEDVN